MRIKEILKEKGLTQAQLAERMGVSLPAVKKALNAESVTTSTLERIAEALEVPVWHLFVSPDEAALSASPSVHAQGVYVCPHCGGTLHIKVE